MKLMVINGSVREGRMSDLVQNWLLSLMIDDTNLEIDVVDLREVDLPFFNESITPSQAGGKYKNPKGTAWAERVAKADAYIFLVAEYNHGPTAVLKNAIDWVYEGWFNKPVGFVGYGGLAGGSRAVEQLKQISLHIKLVPISVDIIIPGVWHAFDGDGKPVHEHMNESLKNFIAELRSLQSRLLS